MRSGRVLPIAALVLLSIGATTTAQSPLAGPSIEIVAHDYHFAGLSTSVPAGTRLALTNTGAEVHQIVIARRVDGVTQTWDELLTDPDPVASGYIMLEGQLFADPGQAAAGDILLARPGDYFAICFVPQGLTAIPDASATPGVDASAPALGPAHYLLGMRQEFSVTAAGSTPGPLPIPTMAPMSSASPGAPSPGASPAPSGAPSAP
ncbi:MAG: hypothetical protein LH650_06255 [Chloroflexi bacterium]|nr:hypothetical protein [Chloroflexota bacterium]